MSLELARVPDLSENRLVGEYIAAAFFGKSLGFFY